MAGGCKVSANVTYGGDEGGNIINNVVHLYQFRKVVRKVVHRDIFPMREARLSEDTP